MHLGGKEKKENKNGSKIKIKYAKEYFITERGEIIKIAAIVTASSVIKDQHR